MRRVVVVALLLAGLSVVAPPPAAHACSCVAPRNLAREVRGADAAFVGVLVATDRPPPPVPPSPDVPVPIGAGDAVHHFRVDQVVKGDLGEQVDVNSPADGGMCGLGVRPGGRTGLLLRRTATGWSSGLCAQADAADLLAATRPGSGHPLWDAAALAALVAAVAFSAAAVARRRQLTRRSRPSQ